MRDGEISDRLDGPAELGVVEKGDHQLPSPGYNYAGDAGQGSTTFSQAESFAHWRHLRLGFVVAGALWITSPHQVRAAPDLCTIPVAGTALCQGDQSAGITNGGGSPDFNTPPTTTLNVNNLTRTIAPAGGIHGINFSGTTGGGVLNADLGAFGITTSGNDAAGIDTGSSHNDGHVTATITGDITTSGDNSEGIFIDVTFEGNVILTFTGNISTTGDGASGIFVRANRDDVTITSSGNITVSGLNSSAVEVDGTNALGGQSNTVTILSGTLTGGTGTGVGVSFAPSDAGSTNTLNNFGTIQALSGTAVLGGPGDDNVQNHGTINGNIDLAGGSNSFRNRVGGIFNSGATVNLGAGNLFLNDGTLSPGGTGNIRTTTLTGNFRQSATGIFAPDVDIPTSTADLLTITGTANLAGQVIPTLVSMPTGTGQVLILSAAGGITDNGITATDTPTVDYTLLFPNANDLLLGFTVDFTMGQGPGPAGPSPADPGFRALTPNQMAVGTYFNNVMVAGNGGLAGVLMAVANIPDMSAYLAALDRLHPEAYLSNMLNSASAADRFAGMATGCPGSGDEGSGLSNKAGNQCLWADVSGLVADQKVTRTAVGFEDRTWNVKGGIQTEISDTLIGGAAFSYENSSTDSDNQGKSEGDRLFGALSLKSNAVGPEIIASVVGGAGWFDVARRIDLPGAGVRAEGEQDLSLVGGRLEIAQNFDIGRLYVRPAVAGGVSYVRSDGFSESGSGATDLRVSSSQETFYYLNPSVEFGGTLSQEDGSQISPFVRLGVAFYKDRDVQVDATMSGAPAELSSFRTLSELDDIIGTVALGVSGKTGENTTFSLSYEGQLSEESQSHQGAARIHVGL